MATQEFFSPLAFDFLWEAMHIGEMPYPLQVRSHGRTEDERIMLRRQANTELMNRGIRDVQGRLEPHIEDWLTLLARPSTSIDALHIPQYQHPPVGVLAGSDGRNGVLAVQDAEGIWIRSVFPEALVSEVVGLLPGGPRGSESSITMPLGDALQTAPRRAMASVGAKSEEPEPDSRRGGRRQRSALSERTVDPVKAYAELAGQPRLRGGQIAANSRDHLGGRQRSPVLAWFDTASGRYLSLARPGPDGREWVTVSPADQKTLRMRVTEMADGVAAGR